MSDYIPRRGDHLYVWRKVRVYQHHGIVVSENDLRQHLSPDLFPTKVEPYMIVEQNLNGLNIVTLREFRTEKLINYTHEIYLVRYGIDPIDYCLNRSGTCYLTARLTDDQIVLNAIQMYNNPKEREIWKSYSLVLKNCEQFAFICSTNLNYFLGEQVSMGVQVVKCAFVSTMFNAVQFSFYFLKDLAEQYLTGLSIEAIIQGNGLAALTAFTVDGLILSIRLFIYFYYEKDRSKNLLSQYAINPEEYLEKMIQAGFCSLSAFGMSIFSLSVGSTLFVSSITPTIASVFFGFLGYIAAKFIFKIILLKLKKRSQEKRILFENPPGDEYDRVHFIK